MCEENKWDVETAKFGLLISLLQNHFLLSHSSLPYLFSVLLQSTIFMGKDEILKKKKEIIRNFTHNHMEFSFLAFPYFPVSIHVFFRHLKTAEQRWLHCMIMVRAMKPDLETSLL